MNVLRFFLLFTLAALMGSSPLASAVEDPPGWQLSLGIGAGVRTNPVMDNDDIPLILIPSVNYQGKRFFIQNLDIGYTLWESSNQQLSLLATPSYDQIFFNEWDAQNFIVQSQTSSLKGDQGEQIPTVDIENRSINKRKLHPRRTAALAGFEYDAHFSSLDFQAQFLHEVTQYYDGDEVRLALSKTLDLGRNKVKLTLGANWQSKETLQYFYGLEASESNVNKPYIADAGVTALMRFDWKYQLNDHWDLRFFTSYRHLSDPIVNSPLVTSNNVVTAFAGGVYHF